MKILIDMNLSPAWRELFAGAGWEAVHWTDCGDVAAPDRSIMEWAHRHGFVVFTHDLDFGALLAATGAAGPSVVQLRSEDVRPIVMGDTVLAALRHYQADIEAGALLSVDPRRMRITLLPLRRV